MFRKIKVNLAAILTSLTLFVVPMAVPVAVLAAPNDIQKNLACGSNLDTGVGSTTCTHLDTTEGARNIDRIVKLVVNIFSAIVGIVSVIMIIYGGFKYVSSGGDSGKVTEARNTIIYAVVGLVVVALAQFIVQFVLNKVSNP